MKTELKSIEEEKQDCIEAFKVNPDTKFVWCCHHDVLIETLLEPWLNRVNYISSCKSKAEQASRFRSFRPVWITLPDQIVKTWAEHERTLAEYTRAGYNYHKARYVYNEAVTEYYSELTLLHNYYKAKNEYHKAMAEYHSELTLLYNQDWPDNTWNGKQVEGT